MVTLLSYKIDYSNAEPIFDFTAMEYHHTFTPRKWLHDEVISEGKTYSLAYQAYESVRQVIQRGLLPNESDRKRELRRDLPYLAGNMHKHKAYLQEYYNEEDAPKAEVEHWIKEIEERAASNIESLIRKFANG